jgi:hypothetical protein
MINVALEGERDEGGNNVGYTSGLVHHMARRGIQSTEGDCGWPPGVVERHQREIGIGQELARQVGNRWVGFEQNGQFVDKQKQRHFERKFDYR